jgi:integrase
MAKRTKGEGSVYTRKDGRSVAATMYEGKRIAKYGATKTEARQKLDAYLTELRSGRATLSPKQTVEQYLTNWLENSRRLKIEPPTLRKYRGILRVHLFPAFGHVQLDRLTSDRVQALYVDMLDRGYSPAMIGDVHDVLNSALKEAIAHEVLSRNPCENVTLPKKKQREPYVLTIEQCKLLVAAARGCRLWFMILVALTTGAREGELLALHWSDIDLNNLRVHIRRSVAQHKGKGLVEKEPKTKSGVRKAILAQVVVNAIPEQHAYIDEIRAIAPKWSSLDLVLPNKYGTHIQPDRVMIEFRRVLAAAGLPLEMHFHDLRHSFATLLFAAGVNPKIAQEALGHSAMSITLSLYGDVLPDMQEETGRLMNKLFS